MGAKRTDPEDAGRATYRVHSGDTLTEIAARTEVPVSELKRLNPEADSFTLQPGQRLRLRVKRQ